MQNLKYWILAFRPKTLTAAVLPIFGAVALARSQSELIQWSLVLFALSSSFCIQIATNLINDAVDFKKGADNENRLGPKRLTQSGRVTADKVMQVGFLFLGLAIALGIPLVIEGGYPIVAIGLVSCVMAYAYTGGPYPLAYRGLGDLFVILFFGLIAVGGMFYLLKGRLDRDALVLGLQVGLLNTILIAINNLRDLETDAVVGKRTLAVRLGERWSKLWIACLIVGPFLAGYYWLMVGKKWLYILPILSLPLGLSVLKRILTTKPSEEYNRYLARSAGYGMIFILSFYIGSFL